MYESDLLFSVFVPFFGSVIVGLLKGKLRNVLAVLISVASLFFVCRLISPVLRGTAIQTSILVFGSDFLTLSFVADGIGIIFAVIFSFLGTIAVIYSLEYMADSRHQNEYYFMTTLMIGSLMGIAFSRNLILMYLFWEVASLATWRLVGFHRGKKETAVANKTFLMIFAGSSFMLFGFVMLYANAHTFDLVALKLHSATNLALFLIFIGIITKAAVLPIHNWLPDAHTVAPSPMSALLSGIVVKIGLLAFVRIFVWTFHTTSEWILVLAAISSIVAASGALIEKDMKKIIAYSTVSQMGYMLLGFAVLNAIGLAAGLLYFIVHAVGKAGLFLSAGIVEKKCGERDISKLGGLIIGMPITGAAFAFCSLSIIGMPPFGGFFSKIMVITAIAKQGNTWIAALAVFAAFLTLLYLSRLFSAVFLGEPKCANTSKAPKAMVACVLCLGILSLAIGLFINKILAFVDIAVKNVF